MKPYETKLSDSFTRNGLLDRFLRYVKIETTSDSHASTIPSTPGQADLAKLLVAEMKALGIKDVTIDDHLYITGTFPASPGYEGKPTIGLLAHMDTSSDVSGKDVKPSVRENYDGKPVRLSAGYELSPVEFPDLLDHVGDTIVTGDGTTLLGADDKAGIAEILTAIDWLNAHPETRHGPIEVIFTPDEETGHGMDLFPMERIKAVACYTVDGSKLGEVEAECFNGYKATVKFTGKVIHLGSARGKLTNAVTMAAQFVSTLPRSESPEATDGWFGYWCPLEIKGDAGEASLEIFIRDFKTDGMGRRIEALKAIAAAIGAIYPEGKVDLQVEKQYLNMRQKLDERPEVLETALTACRNAGVEPFVAPIRGGTDGARLTEKGIPTPNIFTGGYNYHSRMEWASVSEMIAAVKVLVELARLWGERH